MPGLPAASRVFLLSPANCRGTRGRGVLSPGASSDLAVRLRSRAGVPIGELFSYVSALYFRGKLTYARRFAHPPAPDNDIVGNGIQVITPNAGLRGPDIHITSSTLRAFSEQDIGVENAVYRRALENSARRLARQIGGCPVVLLGSVASPKYIDVLQQIFGSALLFPIDFVGRGDMSRGGLLLRHAAAGVELDYVPVEGAVLRGRRPPKLVPCREPG